MKKTLIAGALISILTGCSSDGTSDEELNSLITNTLLNGTWLKACEVDGTSTSFSVTLVLNDGTGTSDVTTYANTTCSGSGSAGPQETVTYTLGSSVTVDGSVAGITEATEFDISFDNATAVLSVVAIENLTTLYTGDNGTTTTRATVLDSIPFILQ